MEDFDLCVANMRDDIYQYSLRLTHNREEAEDLTQDTIYLALKNRERYLEADSMKSWLLTICANIHRNNIKRGKKVITESRIKEESDVSNSIEEQQEECPLLNSLPADVRKVFDMLIKGYKYKEIAYKLATPIGTIKSRISKTRKILLKRISA